MINNRLYYCKMTVLPEIKGIARHFINYAIYLLKRLNRNAWLHKLNPMEIENKLYVN